MDISLFISLILYGAALWILGRLDGKRACRRRILNLYQIIDEMIAEKKAKSNDLHRDR
jgi:hypothetical protein